MYGVSIGHATAVLSKNLIILVISVFCYITIPYPACYHLASEEDRGEEVVYTFKLNEFYGVDQCPEVKKKLVKVTKDITVIWGENESARSGHYKVKDLCPEE